MDRALHLIRNPTKHMYYGNNKWEKYKCKVISNNKILKIIYICFCTRTGNNFDRDDNSFWEEPNQIQNTSMKVTDAAEVETTHRTMVHQWMLLIQELWVFYPINTLQLFFIPCIHWIYKIAQTLHSTSFLCFYFFGWCNNKQSGNL